MIVVVGENDDDPHPGNLQSFVPEYWNSMLDISTSYFHTRFKTRLAQLVSSLWVLKAYKKVCFLADIVLLRWYSISTKI